MQDAGEKRTHAVREISDQVRDEQGPRLQLVVQPRGGTRLGAVAGRGRKDGPFCEGLLLHINPLLLDRQHLDSGRHPGPRADWQGK